MAQKHYYILLPLPLLLTILILSLQPHLSCGSTSSSGATPQQEYEEWLMWNVEDHGHRRSMIRTTDKAYVSKAAALRGSRKSSSTKVLDVKLEKAEMNKMRIVVNPDGTGDFTTITDALNTIPLHNTRRVILEIGPGVYREKIHIPKTKAFITLMGDPNNPPTITGNDTASVIRGDGTRLSTFHSATVAVDAYYFIALNIIFQNTASHEIGSIGEQAVALRISGSKAAFYNCRFYGSQDTLYDHRGLHYFHNCFIQGSVDFIFGYGRSLYENCTLNSISKKVASVTAQKRTSSTLSSGFSFIDCKVTGSGLVYLGRAWGEYSRVVFSFTFLDKLIIPQGWSNWGNPKRNLSVYYGEYKCSGPGSNMTGRVPWARALTDQEVQPFIGPHFVEGETWLISPSTCNYFAFS